MSRGTICDMALRSAGLQTWRRKRRFVDLALRHAGLQTWHRKRRFVDLAPALAPALGVAVAVAVALALLTQLALGAQAPTDFDAEYARLKQGRTYSAAAPKGTLKRKHGAHQYWLVIPSTYDPARKY